MFLDIIFSFAKINYTSKFFSSIQLSSSMHYKECKMGKSAIRETRNMNPLSVKNMDTTGKSTYQHRLIKFSIHASPTIKECYISSFLWLYQGFTDWYKMILI